MIGVTMSPTRSANCSTRPLTPARTIVFFQLHLGLRQRRFGAGLLAGRRDETRRLHGLFCSRGGSNPAQAAFDKKLKLLDFALRDDTGLRFCSSCLVSILPMPAGESSWLPGSGLPTSRDRLPPPPGPPRPRQSCARGFLQPPWVELSSLKIGAPFSTLSLKPT